MGGFCRTWWHLLAEYTTLGLFFSCYCHYRDKEKGKESSRIYNQSSFTPPSEVKHEAMGKFNIMTPLIISQDIITAGGQSIRGCQVGTKFRPGFSHPMARHLVNSGKFFKAHPLSSRKHFFFPFIWTIHPRNPVWDFLPHEFCNPALQSGFNHSLGNAHTNTELDISPFSAAPCKHLQDLPAPQEGHL